MSFGASPSDIWNLVNFVHETYARWKTACGEYAEVTSLLDNAQSVLRHLHDLVKQRSIGRDHGSLRLRDLLKACKTTTHGLNDIILNYGSLRAGKSRSKTWHRIRFGSRKEDVARLERQLNTHISLLNTFLTAKNTSTLHFQQQNVSEILRHVRKIWERENAAVDDAASVCTRWTRHDDDDLADWRIIRRELLALGFDGGFLKHQKDSIKQFLTSLTAEDEDGTVENFAFSNNVQEDAQQEAKSPCEQDAEIGSSGTAHSAREKTQHSFKESWNASIRVAFDEAEELSGNSPEIFATSDTNAKMLISDPACPGDEVAVLDLSDPKYAVCGLRATSVGNYQYVSWPLDLNGTLSTCGPTTDTHKIFFPWKSAVGNHTLNPPHHRSAKISIIWDDEECQSMWQNWSSIIERELCGAVHWELHRFIYECYRLFAGRFANVEICERTTERQASDVQDGDYATVCALQCQDRYAKKYTIVCQARIECDERCPGRFSVQPVLALMTSSHYLECFIVRSVVRPVRFVVSTSSTPAKPSFTHKFLPCGWGGTIFLDHNDHERLCMQRNDEPAFTAGIYPVLLQVGLVLLSTFQDYETRRRAKHSLAARFHLHGDGLETMWALIDQVVSLGKRRLQHEHGLSDLLIWVLRHRSFSNGAKPCAACTAFKEDRADLIEVCVADLAYDTKWNRHTDALWDAGIDPLTLFVAAVLDQFVCMCLGMSGERIREHQLARLAMITDHLEYIKANGNHAKRETLNAELGRLVEGLFLSKPVTCILKYPLWEYFYLRRAVSE